MKHATEAHFEHLEVQQNSREPSTQSHDENLQYLKHLEYGPGVISAKTFL